VGHAQHPGVVLEQGRIELVTELLLRQSLREVLCVWPRHDDYCGKQTCGHDREPANASASPARGRQTPVSGHVSILSREMDPRTPRPAGRVPRLAPREPLLTQRDLERARLHQTGRISARQAGSAFG
jgi:hypothetical protein